MDEVTKTKLADLASDVVKEAGGNEGRAIALAEKYSELLLRLVREIIDTIPSKRDRLS